MTFALGCFLFLVHVCCVDDPVWLCGKVISGLRHYGIIVFLPIPQRIALDGRGGINLVIGIWAGWENNDGDIMFGGLRVR